jgi:membrane protease YdiL (CAAX protease family)
MVIYEENERLLNFLSPAVLTTIGLLLLGLGAWSLAALDFIVPILPADAIMATIIANLAGQTVVTLAVLLLLIPLLHVQSVEHKPLTFMRTLKSIPAFCLVYTVAMGLALVLYLILDLLGIPIATSYGSILLTPAQLANPFNLVVFFVTTTVGAAISEELLFRRTLIPTLETRGMAPLAAVFASSLGFSVIHMPNDILNGSFGFVVSHFITTLIIGTVLGISYVATRNVIFPMILHGLINLVSFGAGIIETIGDLSLLVIYALVILAIWVIGIVVGVIALWQALKEPPAPWAAVLRIKSKINILPGLLGYLLVAVLLVTVQVLGELGLISLLFPNIPLIYAAAWLFYLLFFALLLWLLTQTRYKGVSPPDLDFAKT